MAAIQLDVSAAAVNGLFIADSKMKGIERARRLPLRTLQQDFLSTSAQVDDRWAPILVLMSSATATTQCPVLML